MLNHFYLKLLIFIGFFFALLTVFVSLDAFEWLYEYSRAHEEWELDEWVLILLSALITGVFWFAFESHRLSAEVRKNLEIERDRERKYDAIRRVQTLGTLAGGVAHSGNNLLQPILTMARLGTRKADDPVHVTQAFRHIEDAGLHLADLFASILRFSRGDNIGSGNTDVIDLFSRSRPLFEIGLPDDVRIGLRLHADSLVVPVSENDLIDVMLAIISNAKDAYAENGGEILINVDPSPSTGGFVKISVRDFGSGIPLDDLDRAFEPFFTTKEVGEGTGLGLSIVRNIVERAGGTVGINSAPGAGTTVNIELPDVKAADAKDDVFEGEQ